MTPGQRLFSLDALRGFAILNMIVIHFVLFYSSPEGVGMWVQVALNHLTGADFGAAYFLMLAGVGQGFSWRKHHTKTAEEASRDNKRALVRGCFLFLVGLLLQLLAWGPNALWDWDILPLMGFASILLLLLRPLPSWLLLVLCAVVVLITPWLRQGVDFAAHWGGPMTPVPGINDVVPGLLWDPAGEYRSAANLSEILEGFFVMGYFPVFPWIAHPILGLVLARKLVAGRLGPLAPRLACGGLALALAGLALALWASSLGITSTLYTVVAPLSFYPSSFGLVLMQMGTALIVIPLFYYFLDYRQNYAEKAGILGRCFVRVGQVSLSVYFVHYLLIAWPLWLIFLFTGKFFVANLVHPWTALFIGLAVAAALQPLLARWQKAGFSFGLEWVLGMLAIKIVR